MNVDTTRNPRPTRMEEAPATRPGRGGATSCRTPSEVLAILRPSREKPPAILIGSLWKTGLVPEGAGS